MKVLIIADVQNGLPAEFKSINQVQFLSLADVAKSHGGRQKIGYRYAVRNNFDVVLSVRGRKNIDAKSLALLLQGFENDTSLSCLLASPSGFSPGNALSVLLH